MRLKPVNLSKSDTSIAITHPCFAFMFSPCTITKCFIEPLPDMYTRATSNPFVIADFADDFKIATRHSFYINFLINIEVRLLKYSDQKPHRQQQTKD